MMNRLYLSLCLTAATAWLPGVATAQTSTLRDNWELSFGVQGLSFYSEYENAMDLPKNPLAGFRTTLGAAASVSKWLSPAIGLRTKLSGYWGRAVVGDNRQENAMRLFLLSQQAMLNLNSILAGNDPTRTYGASLYAGVGLSRDCSHNDNSLGLSFGLLNTLRTGQNWKLHLDLGVNLAGTKYQEGRNFMGKYRWLQAEIGLTFNLGSATWQATGKKGRKNRVVSSTRHFEQREILEKTRRTYEKAQENVTDTARVMAYGEIPSGMALIKRGHLRMGMDRQDTLWGSSIPVRDISVDDFWMDKTEVTNKEYRAFVRDVLDSLISHRMADPYYEGDRKKVTESLYIVNPVTGEKQLDTRQVNYCYEVYDYAASMLRRNRLDPSERVLDTDIKTDPEEVVMISKDTAYVDPSGRIIRETIERPLTGPYDFLNTYIVNVYPDTTCWVNDFPNADNEMYSRYYFSHPDYDDYPVVGVTWEQANAFCAWRTERMMDLTDSTSTSLRQRYRLPTEAEWEYAARGRSQNEFPWESNMAGGDKAMLLANFMPDDGNFTKDGNIITSRVGVYPMNTNGLYDMAGNVAEWTSTAYTAAGVRAMNNINPDLKYNAAIEDPYRLKRKSVRGGSWKDAQSHIKSAWRQAEYQNQPRSYIGFRCVRSTTTTPSQRTVIIISDDK